MYVVFNWKGYVCSSFKVCFLDGLCVQTSGALLTM